MRRDIVSAYFVTIARVVAWALVAATVYRKVGKDGFGVLALVQATIGLVEYTAVGLAPAVIRLAAEAMQKNPNAESVPLVSAAAPMGGPPNALDYIDPANQRQSIHSPEVRAVFANGFALAIITAAFGALALFGWEIYFHTQHNHSPIFLSARVLVGMVGIATILRMLSDAPGAALQTSRKIYLDNLLLGSADLIWLAVTVLGFWLGVRMSWEQLTGSGLILGAVVLLIGRMFLSHRYDSGIFEQWWKTVRKSVLRRLLIYGLLVVAAQLADYLYAPANYLIIGNMMDPEKLGIYSPAVQIDGALLLLVSAVAAVLLPRTALVHAEGHIHAVRKYYLRGTLATTGVLVVAAIIAGLGAPLVFNVWLRDPSPDTCAILRLMLIHTVIGGSSAVGRAILLATGKVKAFTAGVLIAGVTNVICGIGMVHFFPQLGLVGIVIGTIIAVTGRCLVWLPWYVMRTLRVMEQAQSAVSTATAGT